MDIWFILDQSKLLGIKHSTLSMKGLLKISSTFKNSAIGRRLLESSYDFK